MTTGRRRAGADRLEGGELDHREPRHHAVDQVSLGTDQAPHPSAEVNEWSSVSARLRR
jgi:hypothetical protein